MNKLLTLQETASHFRISMSTLYRWVHQKKIQYVKIGSRVLFSEEKLLEFIDRNTQLADDS